MIKKRSILLYTLGLVAYFFIFANPLEAEYYLHNTSIISLAKQEVPLQQNQGEKAFAIGNYFGYLNKDFTLASLQKNSQRVAFNDTTYLFYDSESTVHPVYNSEGLHLTTITNNGLPFVIGKTIYMVNNQQSIIDCYTTAGQKQWSYDTGSFITSISFQESTIAVGLLDGYVLFLNKDGQFESEYRVGGSRIDVVYGVGLSKSGRYAGIVSGLEPQRFVLLERGVYGYSPFYSVDLERSLKRAVQVTFSDNEQFVSYEEDGLFYTYGIKNKQNHFVPIEGTLTEVKQDIIPGFQAIVSQLGNQYYLKMFSYEGYYPLLINQYKASASSLEKQNKFIVLAFDDVLLQWTRSRGNGDTGGLLQRFLPKKRVKV